MIKAVGYIRRSTDRQEESLKDQETAITKYAKENSFELLRFYRDDAIPGTFTYNRQGFQEMIETATNGKKDFDKILVWNIKRFSRGDGDEAGHYRYILREKGVEVIYITENLRGDDSDDLVTGTKQWLARQESKDISLDVIRGMMGRISKGLSSPGHPYGYYRQIVDKDGKVIQICKRGEKSRASNEDCTRLIPGDPKEIKVVRRVFDMYVNRGMGYRLIARELNKEGIPSPFCVHKPRKYTNSHTNETRIIDKPKWNLCAVEYILSNPVYIGDLVYNRTTKAKFHRITRTNAGYEAEYRGKITKTKTERYKDKDRWFIVKDVIKPIVSRELFYKAQKTKQQRRSNKSFSGRATTSNYLWTSLIRCKHCGKSMNGNYVKTKYGKNPYYVCEGCVVEGKRKKSVVSATQLDNLLLRRIKERFFNSNRLQNTLWAIKEQLSEQKHDSKLDAAEIEKRLKDNEDKINNLLDLIEPRHKDLINSKLDKLREERDMLLTEKQKIPVKRIDFNPDKLAEEILGCAKDFDKVLEQGEPFERKEIVRSYIGQIIIDTDIKHAKVGFYPLPKIPSIEPVFSGYAMNLE